MVGLGETDEEVQQLLDDMKAGAIDIVSIGQYLRPSPEQAEVVRIYSTAEFEQLEKSVIARDFLAHEVGPFVRSSYMARDTLAKLNAELAKRKHG
jgi:lipoic acid synthetase